jgi:hypothetical protein
VDLISRTEIEETWDTLAGGSFDEAVLRQIRVRDCTFLALHLPRDESFKPRLAWRTGLSFLAVPRFAAYRHRLVLVPADVFISSRRSEITEKDIEDLLCWSAHMQHIVTVSTFKSGASHPFTFHAQSFPLERARDGMCLTALSGLRTTPVIEEGEMPHFTSLRIDSLNAYPLRGIRIAGELMEVSKKTYELALNYDHLKAFNLVILPTGPDMYFFPRNKNGNAIYRIANRRWQIAALEANGLMQAKKEEDAAKIDAAMIDEIFSRTGLSQREFQDFMNLLSTF